MTDSRQIIPLIPGLNRIIPVRPKSFARISTDLILIELLPLKDFAPIPTDRMLIELLRPGSDPNLNTICRLIEEGIDGIPDDEKQSQSNLIKYNNFVISKIMDYLYLDDSKHFNRMSNFIVTFCTKNNLDFYETLYHLSVVRYINFMFLGDRITNYKKTTILLGEFSSLYCKSGFKGLAQLADRAEIEESTGNRESLIGKEYINSSNLEKRFPDYKLANDCLAKFFCKVIFYPGKDNPLISLFRSGQNELAILKSNDIYSTVNQCPFCHKWFEVTNFKNGKIKSSYCGKDLCKTKWESARKKKITVNVWQKDPNQNRGRCKECRKARQVNKDRICKKCWQENMETT